MAQCTAPRNGHRTANGVANCPACSSRSRRYASYPSYPTSYSSSSSAGTSNGGGSTSGSRSTGVKASWSRSGSSTLYTPNQIVELKPIREKVEEIAEAQPELLDVFLCHAWNDRKEAARELNDLLVARGVKVWFSEDALGLGVPMMRAIDKGLANSRIGIVLATPDFIARLPQASTIDKELSALLAEHRLIPVVHNTTYADLRKVSPLLASRTGLDTGEETMAEIAAKIAETVTIYRAMTP